MGETEETKISHVESIILAVLLYLLGDKSLLLAKLVARAFTAKVDGKVPPPSPYVYEVSLFGLLIGTCLVILISRFWNNAQQKDHLEILVGLLIASIGALLNILDAALFDTDNKHGEVPTRALFFFALWIIIVLIPVLVRVFGKEKQTDLDLEPLLRIVTALLVAAVIGAIMRLGIGAVLLYGLQVEGATKLNEAFDRMRFNSDSLVILGAVWWVAAYAPSSQSEGRNWRTLYTIAAPLAAFFYAYCLSFPGGDLNHNVSADRMAVGFAALALAAILPGYWFAKEVIALNKRALFKAVVWTFALCTAAMYAGLSGTYSFNPMQRIGVSVLQGLAGACIPIAVFASKCALQWLSNRIATRLNPDPTA